MTIRLMFEWGGGSLWPGDADARARYDVGPLDDVLGLPGDLHARMEALSARHDTALNWDDPAGPGMWTPAEEAVFAADAEALHRDLAAWLGPDVTLVLAPL